MEALVVCGFLALILALAVVSRAVRLPYPIVFLLGGIALALIPGLPPLRLEPDLVFLLFLPPLVFGDGFTTDWRQFRRYIRPITALATGLVLVTSITVAFVANAVIGLPLPIGLVLGAILSPTDTVATEAIAESSGLPRRVQTILSGESLVNDATGLTLYKFAVGAIAAAGAFSWNWALPQFAYVAILGVAIGVLGALVLANLSRFLTDRGLADESIVVLLTLVSPYVLYLAADRIGASGVLAAAAGGITMSRKGGGIYTSDARIVASGVWSMLFFTFNGALFIVLGLELRETFAALRSFPIGTLIAYAAAIAGTVIVTRLVWVFVVAEARARFDRNIIAREGPRPPRSWTLILGWAGMRGIVSLAAALALPEAMANGGGFPARDLILFTTFAVILVTLLGQGLSLPWLIRVLRIREVEDARRELALARIRTAEAGLQRLQQLEPSFVSPNHWEVAGKLRSHYEEQLTHFQAAADGAPTDGDAGMHELTRTFVRETMAAERRILAEMRHLGQITDEVYRHINYELDLAEARLA